MCGHVGIVSRDIFKNHLGFFENALYADALRGEDGTGVAFLDRNFNVRIMKKAMGARDFIDMKKYNDMMYKFGLNSKFIMGHNRWATKGGIDNKTSHPFHHGDILMAHNGSLRSQWRLPDSKDYGVDSENIAHSLSKLGVEETIPLLDGSYSLVWANTQDNTVSFIRNKERPMYFGLTKDKKTILYASEELMIEWLADRNGVVLDSIANTEVDTLYTFDMSPDKEKEVLVPTAKVIKGYSFQAAPATRKGMAKQGNVSDSKVLEFQDKRRVSLNQIGLRLNQRVEFDITDFSPYTTPKGTQRGVLEGYMANEPWCDVKIYGFNNTDLKVGKGDVLTSRILSIVIPDKKHHLDADTLVLSADYVEVAPLLSEIVGDAIDKGKAIYKGPDGLVNHAEWTFLTGYGCSSCTDNLFHKDHEDISWMNKYSPLCPDCTKTHNTH